MIRPAQGFTTLVAALVIGSAPAPAAAQAAAPDSVADGVRAALTDYGRRLNAGDYDGVLAYYADDPRFFWVDREKVVATSKADIVAGFRKLRGSSMHITYETPRVTVLSPTAALLTAGFSASMGSGAKAARFSGLLTALLIKTPAGWRFLSGRA